MQGNDIGTDASGTKRLSVAPFSSNGVYIQNAPANTIGGTVAGAGNLISGNSQYGIAITDQSGSTFNSDGTIVQGNLIGTDVTGTGALGNGSDGVNISSSNPTTAINDLIGGNTAAAGNTISSNGRSGVSLGGGLDIVVQSNLIGTDITGTVPLGNGFTGVQVSGAGSSTIAGNVVSANVQGGIQIQNTSATGNLIEENFIGTDPSGTINLGNGGNGIWVMTSNNTVGGTSTGAGNTIAFNKCAGECWLVLPRVLRRPPEWQSCRMRSTATATWGSI